MEVAVFAVVLEPEKRRLINTEDLIRVPEEKVYLVTRLLLGRNRMSPVSVYFASNLLESVPISMKVILPSRICLACGFE